MTPKHAFNRYLDIVAAESGISKELILSKCRERDVVDARHILFNISYIYSAYQPQIARLSGYSELAVRCAIRGFNNRLKQSRFMQNVWADVLNALKQPDNTSLKIVQS